MRSKGALAGEWRRATGLLAERGIARARGRRLAVVLVWLVMAILAACSSSPRTVQKRTGVDPSSSSPSPSLAGQHVPPPLLRDTRLRVVNAIISHMTLDQKLGQLFIVEYLYPDPNHPDLQNMISHLGAGGVILYKSMNIASVGQMQQLTSAMQAAASIPLIIGADEEGGGDEQIDGIFGPHPTEWQIGQTGDPQQAARLGAQLASELKQLGVNADFAPVVDVLDPRKIWIRPFSRSPTVVSQMGAAEVDAMQSAGVMACPKHFPGLGAALVNPHDGLPVITSSRQHIEQVDLAPYRALMAHHPAMIMTTDLLMPALDPTMPAELSYPIVTGILRDEIGYDGVVVTDALYMGGITDRYSMAEAGVLAILAGNDMLEGPWDTAQMSAMVDALRAAVQSGRLSTARIDASVRRILLLKQQYGLLPSMSYHRTGPGPAAGDLAAGVSPWSIFDPAADVRHT
ncbi:MAG TPA: glycoside hydrolase family 3 N-terminal domain-containing protein [Ktedonobacterales bacterium]